MDTLSAHMCSACWWLGRSMAPSLGATHHDGECMYTCIFANLNCSSKQFYMQHICCFPRVPIVQLFGMDQGVEERLTPCSRLTLPHSPLDLTFDLQGRLLVLLDSQVTPFQIYVCMEDRWEVGFYDSMCILYPIYKAIGL